MEPYVHFVYHSVGFVTLLWKRTALIVHGGIEKERYFQCDRRKGLRTPVDFIGPI